MSVTKMQTGDTSRKRTAPENNIHYHGFTSADVDEELLEAFLNGIVLDGHVEL